MSIILNRKYKGEIFQRIITQPCKRSLKINYLELISLQLLNGICGTYIYILFYYIIMIKFENTDQDIFNGRNIHKITYFDEFQIPTYLNQNKIIEVANTVQAYYVIFISQNIPMNGWQTKINSKPII